MRSPIRLTTMTPADRAAMAISYAEQLGGCSLRLPPAEMPELERRAAEHGGMRLTVLAEEPGRLSVLVLRAP